jgi:hypothetical protein
MHVCQTCLERSRKRTYPRSNFKPWDYYTGRVTAPCHICHKRKVCIFTKINKPKR